MRALITGGAGFIGSHLAEALLRRGHQVTAVDDLSTGSLDNLEAIIGDRGFDWVHGSVTDEGLMTRLVHDADVVFHLAAAVGVQLVVDAPIHTIETNVNGTAVVLRCARRNRTRVVVASTSEVYGKSATLPFRETADLVLGPPTKPRWGYAASKLIDEFLALAYYKEHQVPTTVVRFFNCVGPRQSSRYGMVLPNFVQRALSGEPLTIYGDGSQTRSFTWIGDVVSALLRIVDEPRTIGEIFNIGNDHEVSIAELAMRVQQNVGASPDVHFVPHADVFGADFEDMQRRVPDISKIRRVVGWEPQVRLDEIIVRTVNYWQDQEAVTVGRQVTSRGVDAQSRVALA
jgi:UDP-glucose 4-epimerase